MWLVTSLKRLGPWWAPAEIAGVRQRDMRRGCLAHLARFSARKLVWRVWWRWPRHPVKEAAGVIEAEIRYCETLLQELRKQKGGVQALKVKHAQTTLAAVHERLLALAGED